MMFFGFWIKHRRSLTLRLPAPLRETGRVGRAILGTPSSLANPFPVRKKPIHGSLDPLVDSAGIPNSASKNPPYKTGDFHESCWRHPAESNRSPRLCRPLYNRSTRAPGGLARPL